MGATALEPGQPEGGTVPRLRKRPATENPETLVAQVFEGSPAGIDKESAEEYPAAWSVDMVGPRGRGLRNTISSSEADLFADAEDVPRKDLPMPRS